MAGAVPPAVIAAQGEMVDQIAWRIYGDTAMTAAILKANPGLADFGPRLPHGTRVALPPAQPATRTPISLWD